MSVNKVLIDCERLKYENTGLWEYCNTLIQSLNKYNKNKNLELIFYIPKKTKSLYSNINSRILSFFHKIYLPKYKKIKVFHATYQNSNYFPSKSHNWKIILTIHDYNFLVEKQCKSKHEESLNDIKKKIDMSDIIVFISDYVMQQTINLWGESKKYKRIYNGINENIATLPAKPYKNVKDDIPYVFSIGTVLEKKMFHTIIPIIKNIPYNYVIAGITTDRKYLEFIKSEIVKYDVANKVKILGAVTNEEKRWLLKHCEAFIFPSKAEGFGIPLIEAMLFGKPCFTTKRCSMPEIGGKHAYYFDNYNTENMLNTFNSGINDFKNGDTEKKQKEMIAWASQFNLKLFAENYLKLYESLV